MSTSSGTLTPENVALVAHDVTLRLEHWYAQHRIALPAETKAEFTRMAFEALVANPDRERGDLLDDLLAELDDMLEEIAEQPDVRGAPNTTAEPPGRMQNWLERLRGRRR